MLDFLLPAKRQRYLLPSCPLRFELQTYPCFVLCSCYTCWPKHSKVVPHYRFIAWFAFKFNNTWKRKPWEQSSSEWCHVDIGRWGQVAIVCSCLVYHLGFSASPLVCTTLLDHRLNIHHRNVRWTQGGCGGRGEATTKYLHDECSQGFPTLYFQCNH